MEKKRPVARRPPGRIGPYGRQPAYWLLRDRGMTQQELGSAVLRSTSYVNGVLNGLWAPDPSFLAAVSEFLGEPPEALFTPDVLEASEERRRDGAAGAAAIRGRVGPYGRQPAYWVLRGRGIAQTELKAITGRSHGYVSQVLNGWGVPDPSFVNTAAEFLALAPDDLFTSELLQAASRHRPAVAAGAPPSQRVGPYARQPAYFVLREQGVRQRDLASITGRSTGFVSAVLNGFSVPDRGFVEAVSERLERTAGELFSSEVLRLLHFNERQGRATTERAASRNAERLGP